MTTVPAYRAGRTLLENPLNQPADVAGFRLEGAAAVTFPGGRMRMENLRDPKEEQKANSVFWCPRDFPDDIEMSWDFWEPIPKLNFSAGHDAWLKARRLAQSTTPGSKITRAWFPRPNTTRCAPI